MRVGFHVSIGGSIDKAVDRAVKLGCGTFQIFTRNPRQWRARELTSEEVKAFIVKLKRGFKPVFGHMPYLPNLASPRTSVYLRSIEALISELKRCRRLRIPYLVTHLGSHLGDGVKAGLRRVINAVERAFNTVGGEVVLLLENSAGTRNSIGSSFEEIACIVEKVSYPELVGVCFDTCHAFAAGYELRTQEALEETLRKFDDAIGFERLKLVHLNDSKGDLKSHIDHHEHIGLGMIGEDGFRNMLKSDLRRLPLILETPRDRMRGDLENIIKVRELAGEG